MPERKSEQAPSPKDRLFALSQERAASTTAAGNRIKTVKDNMPVPYHSQINTVVTEAMGIGRDEQTIRMTEAMIQFGLSPKAILTILDQAETIRREKKS